MSKHLMKILSICAMVMLLPLIIVGAALCITEAIPVTLTVYQGGNEGDYIYEDSTLAPSAKVSIFLRDDTNSSWIEQVDENGQPVTKVSMQKNDEIKVLYSESVGYDFHGWYKGTPTEYTADSNAKETKTEYTFFIRGNTTLTAIRNVKTYTVNYTGYYNDGTDIADDENLVLSETVQYNESLLTLSPKQLEGIENTSEFKGWVVEGSTGDVVTRANFDTSTLEGKAYTLTAIWTNQATVIYWNSQNQRIATNYYTIENYSSDLLEWNDELYGKFLTRGYQFDGWVNSENEEYALPESFTEGVYNVYIKETPIVYSNTIEKSAVDNTQATLTYDVESKFADGVPFEREYYTFSGISYNGNLYACIVDDTDPNNIITDYVYNGSSLGDVIVDNGSIEGAYAVWQSNYANYEWQIQFIGDINANYGDVYYVVNGETFMAENYPENLDFQFNIVDDDEFNSVQLEDSLIDIYTQMKGISGIENWNDIEFYIDVNGDGLLSEDEKATLSEISIGSNPSLASDYQHAFGGEFDSYSMGDLLNTIEEISPEIFAGFQSTNQVYAYFVFKTIG